MAYRNLEINIISARGLKQVNLLTKMDVYVVVSISGGDAKAKHKTPVDNDGDTNPTWNYPINFTVDESAVQQNRLTLVFNLRCERALGDKDIGEVIVPVKELLEDAGEGKPAQFVRYQVMKPSGKPKGELNFSYKFGEKDGGSVLPSKPPPQSVVKSDEPVTSYPAAAPALGPSSMYPPPYVASDTGPGSYPPPGGYQYPHPPVSGYGYPPPGPPQYPQYGGYPHQPPPPSYGYPPQQGYGYPPQQGYGYPPQQGYGYPPVQQQPKKNNFGLGLGAGLLGGAVGGMLIGDMVSDAGAYDAGYDAGFDDAGF